MPENTQENTEKKEEYLVLARKYRPQNFDQLKGQDALVRTLTNAINSGRVAHAFMLTGVRGVGKTTTARIIARALNCVGEDGKGGPTPTPCGVCEQCKSIAEDRNVDVLEMDAASRTGVDDIREIIDSVQYAPSAARYKIYIIDEVHMLSKAAFNALLKTLEEPPEHVKFIFATTEIRKVPITVLSRCQRFDLRRIGLEVLIPYLDELVGEEGLEAEEDAISQIARAADGSARDGLSLLDQAIALSDKTITAQTVSDMLGLVDRALLFDLYHAVMAGDAKQSFDVLEKLYTTGADPVQVLEDLLDVTHFLTKCKVIPGHTDDIALPEIERKQGGELATQLSMPVITRAWQILQKGLAEVRVAPHPQQSLEMVLVRLLYAADLPAPGDLVKKLKDTDTPSAPGSSPSTPSPQPSGQTVMKVAAQGGGNVPSKPQSELVVEPVAEVQTVAIPQNFEDVVALCHDQREPMLSAHLFNHAHVVKFSVSQIELRLNEQADKSVTGLLSKRLSEWTGQRWIVSISNKPGAPTLAEQKQEKDDALKADIMTDPNVKAIIEAFPGAEITSITAHDPKAS